jgi:8-oxo-dGTP pyrophosphatase MutT (NUDIX family)
MQFWRTHSRRKVFETGKWLSVELRQVESPSGHIIEDWPWVKTPDYVNVVPVNEAGEFLCFRQDKYAFDQLTLAPVGGYIEPGEDPLPAAQRELLEEMGCCAEQWLPLGSYWVDPNRGVAVGHLFLALGVRKVTERNADDLEQQELLRLTRDEVEAALDAGEFKVLAWAANMTMALRALDRKNKSENKIIR